MATHRGFDHVTIAVSDLAAAVHFFGLLGFELTASTVVSGQAMSDFMGIADWQADHAPWPCEMRPRISEVQLLFFHQPVLGQDRDEANLARLRL